VEGRLIADGAIVSSRDAASRLKFGTPRAWRALPWGLRSALARGSAIDCLGRDAAPPGSDLCGNAVSNIRDFSNRNTLPDILVGSDRYKCFDCGAFYCNFQIGPNSWCW
jgi:hypothetical protein